MKHQCLIALTIAFSFSLPHSFVAAQDDRDAERLRRNTERENDRIRRAVEKAYVCETVIERWKDEIGEHFPKAMVLDAKGEPDFDIWFVAISGGRPYWNPNEIRDRSFQSLFSRAKKDLHLSGSSMTSAQFHSYAQHYLRAWNSPVWERTNPEETAKDYANYTFRDMDRNRNGVLEFDEQSLALRMALRSVDQNGDHLVNSDEYRKYFKDQMIEQRDHPLPEEKQISRQDDRGRENESRPPEASPESSVPMPQETESAPTVQVPEWFVDLDEDGDGQVGLYEWRKAGRKIEEYIPLDRSDDGYLTARELNRYLIEHPESPYHGNQLP